MKRRDFLKLTSTAPVALTSLISTGCTHKKFYNPDQDIIIGGGRYKKGGEIHNMLAIANLRQRETQLVTTHFLPHGTYIDPNNKKRILTFEKNGDHAAIIDLDNHEVSDIFSTENTNSFCGHGTFNTNGKYFISIETDTRNSEGMIIVRDNTTLKVIDKLSTYGKNPHHCKLIDDGKILAVTNCGDRSTPASVTFIELDSRTLIEDMKIADGEMISSHLAISDDDQLVFGSAPPSPETTGQVRISNGTVKLMTEPKALTEKLFGEALSICIDERHGIAVITHPQANLLTFWSMNEQKLYKAMSVPNPRGISLTLDKKHYIVNYGINTSTILIRTKDLVANKESIMQPTYTSGDHHINWSKTLTEIMPGRIYR